MKKYIPIITIVSIIGFSWSCTKKSDLLATYNYTPGRAYVKVLHYAPSLKTVTAVYRDSFNVYVNGTKVNASFLMYNSIFPSGNPYFAVPAGPQSIRITMQGIISPDSITLATFSKTLEADGYYSLILTDSLLKGNDAKQIFVRDNFAATDTGHFTLRFIHAIPDATADTVDVFSTLYNANIFTKIPPGGVTAFSPFQYTVATDALIVRKTGTTTALATLGAASFARTKAYTIVYKGLNTTTGAKPRALVQYTNL